MPGDHPPLLFYYGLEDFMGDLSVILGFGFPGGDQYYFYIRNMTFHAFTYDYDVIDGDDMV